MSHQRFASASSLRTSSTTSGEGPKYVSPTFKSSIFNHSETEPSAPVRGVRTHQSFNRMSEDFTQSSLGGWHNAKTNHAIPTVKEWNPKRHHVNDPNAYDGIEEEAIAHSKKKAEELYHEANQRKQQRNREYNDHLIVLEKKHWGRLDHKKPSDDTRKEHKEAQESHINSVLEKNEKQNANKKELLKTLQHQMNENDKKQQADLHKDKNDTRTGLDLKPRVEFDIKEHKIALVNQLEEGNRRRSQAEQAKQQERQERIKNMQEQEAAWASYRDKLASRKSQSSEGLRLKGTVYKVDLVEETNKRQGGVPTRFNATVRNETSPERHGNHWEAVTNAMLKKKEQVDYHLKVLQGQILEKKKSLETQQTSEKHEEKRQSGLKMTQYKPKESAVQTAEVVKLQLAAKEEARKAELRAKAHEKAKAIDSHKAHEESVRQKTDQAKQLKSELHMHYQVSLTDNASKKKHGGLTTVKI